MESGPGKGASRRDRYWPYYCEENVWHRCDALVRTGETKWEFRQHSPPWAGVMATAGGLVFAGSGEGNFFALDADTGDALWQFQTGGAVRSNPIAFTIDGKQHIAIASGQAIFVFGL